MAHGERADGVAHDGQAGHDGGAGIARRVGTLLKAAEWPAQRPPGVAVFTRAAPEVAALAPALARYGLERTEIL